MNDKLVVLLSKLSDKLGVTTLYLWGVLVRQAHIESIKYGFLTLLLLLLTLLSSWGIYKLFKEENFINSGGIFVTLILTLLFSSIFILPCANSFIDAYFNPQFWALQTILGSIQK